MSVPLSSLPRKYQGVAAAQLARQNQSAIKESLITAKPHIRQRKDDGMNKWEREFFELLRARNFGPGVKCSVHREVSLPLANGLRYKVDFIEATSGSETYLSRVFGYEVKGFRRSTGIAKLKMAATLYPWIRFYLVTREKGVWQYEEVLP